MKKETISTFSGGLNYDLNPITTPNNVLTDCVNGSFVTFNGDELALQNDAGNTKIIIPVKDSGGNPAEMWEGDYDFSIGSIVYMPEDHATYYQRTGTDDTEPTTLIGWSKFEPEYVKLTDRFYPLGIKEYGGVLYIVSACDYYTIDLTAVDWDPTHPYNIGEIVKYKGYYFKSIIDNNLTSLADPIFTEDEQNILLYRDNAIISFESGWDWLNESEWGERIQKVEFGSYPSPEFSGTTQEDGIEMIYNGATQGSLYKSVVISNSIFKSGRYINFSKGAGNIDTSFVSYFDVNSSKITKLYRVKLWHQLNNGFLDLTSDVWSKYIAFRNTKQTTLKVASTVNATSITVASTEGFPESGTLVINNLFYSYGRKTETTFEEVNIDVVYPVNQRIYLKLSDFWFNEPTFVYFCPNQYKGKLAISVEIEPLDVFDFGFIDLEYNSGSKQYILTLPINVKRSGNITIPSVHAELYMDGIFKDEKNDIPVVNGVTQIQFTLSEEIYKEKVIDYKIIPNLLVEGFTYRTSREEGVNLYIENFPSEYTNKYILSGSRLITSILDDVKFILEEGDCDPKTGIKSYNQVTLQNSSGSWLDENLSISENRHVLLRGDTVKLEGDILIGRFTVTTNGYPDTLTGTVGDNLLGAFKSILVNVPETSCSTVELTVRPSNEANNVFVTQNGELLESTTKIVEGKPTSYVFNVIPGTPFLVDMYKDGFIFPIAGYQTITEASGFDYALVADIMFTPIKISSLDYIVKANWETLTAISGLSLITLQPDPRLGSESIELTFKTSEYKGEGYITINSSTIVIVSMSINESSNVTGITYANIGDPDSICELNNILFNSIYKFRLSGLGPGEDIKTY